jgi:uncharacterized membrane protein YgcG
MSQRKAFLSLSVALVTFIATSIACGQTERIRDYHSQIEVLKDGSLKVTETIDVTAAGQKIKRGINRDFPTAYTTKYFVKVELPFDVVSVKRDGKSEPFHTEKRSNGVRVYVGNENSVVSRGQHTYEITYTTNYQLGYFNAHDELYWNVTGNGWDFPIDRASASVVLPEDVPRDELTLEGYTGPAGSKAKNLTSQVNPETGAADFATTVPLRPHEGLTVVVGFPKGHVREPTAAERRALYLRAGSTVWLVLGGLLAVSVYYLLAWFAVGRDPPGGAIFPQFAPPLDLPPACVRYLRRMGYDKKCFTAAIINMAVKRFLTIEEDDGEYTLKRNEGATKEKLSPGERGVAAKLLKSGSITLKQTHHTKISEAIQKLGERLSGEFEGKLFVKNRWWLVPGWLLSAAAIAAVALSSGWQAVGIAGFMAIWLSVWTIGCVALAVMVTKAWRSTLTLRRDTMGRIGSFGGALFITLFALPFFAFELFGFGMLVVGTTIWMVPLLVGIVAMNWTFWHLIKQPTVEGQRVMDAIEGFRMYLGTAEGEFLRRMHAPDATPELFERYLPYALALDVENEWSEKFSEVLARAASAAGEADGYQPVWYHGSGWQTSSPGAFAGGLAGSLGGAISSSSTAPGGSSGGGGGGSSGGGGGGGGGGGW